MRPPRGEVLILAAVVAFVALFSLVPSLLLFGSSIAESGGWNGVAAVATDPLNVRAFDNSFLQGGLSALLATALGYPAGVFLGRYRWPGRAAVRSMLLVPFLLPSVIVVLGVSDLFGPAGILSRAVPDLSIFGGGIPGIVAANLFFNVPVVMLFTAAGCESASVELEETVASLGGTPVRAYLETWARPSWAGAVAGGLLTFVFSALSFAPPLLLCGERCYTVEVRIYSLDQVLLAPPAAGVLAALTVALFLVPIAAYLTLLRRLRPTARERTYVPRSFPPRSPVAWLLAAPTAGVLVAESALLGTVLYRSVVPPGGGTPGASWLALFAPATTARLDISAVGVVENTLFFAGLATVFALVIGLASGFLVVRHRTWAPALGLLFFVPILLSPVVVAYSLAAFWRPLLGGSTNVWVLIVVSQSILGLPFALQSLEIPLTSLPRSAAEAAEALGASRWGAYVDAELPRVRGGIWTAALFALALGLGEFTATYFLVTPRFTTLSVAVYGLTNDRLFPVADAAAGLLLVVSLAVYLALAVGGRRAEL
jgi:thiamine transport system permease protein